MRNLAVLMSSLILAACAVGPDYRKPEVATPDSFVGVDGAQFSTADMEREFWKAFNDEQLNGMIEQALAANHDIRIATARLREARALRGGFADSRILEIHGQRMVERDFAKRGAITVQLKDLRNALATGAETDFDAPITALFESLYASAAEHGFADADHSGLWLELARRNGMG